MSWWAQYHGRCMGRAIHFLYHYCDLHVAEHAIIGGNDITYRGKRIATYTWRTRFGEADVPEFAFEGEHAERWGAAQIERRERAIEQARPTVPAKDWQPMAPEQLHAFNPEIERRATPWAGIVAKAEPQFFTVDRTLYFVAGGHYHYWHRETGAWLRAAAPEG